MDDKHRALEDVWDEESKDVQTDQPATCFLLGKILLYEVINVLHCDDKHDGANVVDQEHERHRHNLQISEICKEGTVLIRIEFAHLNKVDVIVDHELAK